MVIFVVRPSTSRALRSVPVQPPRSRHHPRQISVVAAAGQGARRHRRPADDRARLPARRPPPRRVVGHRRHRRRADPSRRSGVRRRGVHDVAPIIRAAPIGSPRSPPSSTSRNRRQRAGRRAADRAGDDRRSGRAAARRPVGRDDARCAGASTTPADLANPNVTKVVVDREGYALYFSRAPIPLTRAGCPPAPAWRHVGLYVYRRDCLLQLASLAADGARGIGSARTAAGARARHPHPRGRNQIRLNRRRHAGRSRTGRGG